MKILIVEDEARLAQALAQILGENRYLVDIARDGEDGLAYAQQGQYDAVVLDVMLPGLTGFEVARRLRAGGSATPILMLTAKDEVASKVWGLDCGADDYMTKPFAAEELLARLRALTRRPGELLYETMAAGDATLNLSTHALHCGDKSLHLSHKEFEILRILMAAKEAVTPKESLIVKVWGADSSAEDNNVEAYISFLRKKLMYVGSAVEIETLRKVGYRLRVPAL